MYIYIKGYCLDYGLRMWPVQRGEIYHLVVIVEMDCCPPE